MMITDIQFGVFNKEINISEHTRHTTECWFVAEICKSVYVKLYT